MRTCKCACLWLNLFAHCPPPQAFHFLIRKVRERRGPNAQPDYRMCSLTPDKTRLSTVHSLRSCYGLMLSFAHLHRRAFPRGARTGAVDQTEHGLRHRSTAAHFTVSVFLFFYPMMPLPSYPDHIYCVHCCLCLYSFVNPFYCSQAETDIAAER